MPQEVAMLKSVLDSSDKTFGVVALRYVEKKKKKIMNGIKQEFNFKYFLKCRKFIIKTMKHGLENVEILFYTKIDRLFKNITTCMTRLGNYVIFAPLLYQELCANFFPSVS
jgi:hypothetical protein